MKSEKNGYISVGLVWPIIKVGFSHTFVSLALSAILFMEIRSTLLL